MTSFNINAEIHSFALLMLIVNAIVHLLFAGAVARDASIIVKNQQRTHLVSPMTWAFATLVGGVIVATIYWFMHHIGYIDMSRRR